MDADTKVYFDAPEGLELDGEEGESLIAWKKVDDRYLIVAIDGIPLSKEEAQEAEEDEASEASPTEDTGSDDLPKSGY